MNALIEFCERNRRGVVLFLVAATAAGLFGVSRLEFDDSPRDTFRRDDEAGRALEQFYADFGADDNDVIVIVEGDDLFTPPTLNTIRDIAERAQTVEGVQSVYSIFDIRRQGIAAIVPLAPYRESPPEDYALVRERARAHPLVTGHLLSDDARTMLIFIRLSGAELPVSHLQRVVEQLRSQLRDAAKAAPLHLLMTGHPVIRADVFVTLRQEQLKFTSLSAIVASIISLILFRRLATVVMTVSPPAVGVIWTAGVLGMAGIPVNGINTIIPTLVFVVGFTDAVHLMFQFCRMRQHGIARERAAVQVMRELAPACAMTSLTTAIGFGSLGWASNPAIRDFGLVCALGAVFTFLSVMLVFPLLASTRLGENVTIRRPRASRWSLRRNLLRVISFSVSHARTIVFAALAVSLIMVMASFRLRPDIRWTETMPTGSETTRAMEKCDDAFGGAFIGSVVVQWPESQDLKSAELHEVVERVHEILEDTPQLRSSYSVQTLLNVLPGESVAVRVRRLQRIPADVLNRMVRPDRRRLVVSVHLPDIGAAALKPVLDNIEQQLGQLHEQHPGYEFQLTGTVVVAARNLHRVIGDLARSLSFAALVIFLVITCVLRSVSLGLISVLPNAIPLLFIAAFLYCAGQPLQMVSVLTLSFCLGIAVDDTIHFLMSYRRFKQRGRDVRSAVRRAICQVGAALVSTTVVLAGGFSVMLASSMPILRLFGLLTMLAVIVALLADLVILPASLVFVFGGDSPANRRAAVAASRRKRQVR